MWFPSLHSEEINFAISAHWNWPLVTHVGMETTHRNSVIQTIFRLHGGPAWLDRLMPLSHISLPHGIL